MAKSTPDVPNVHGNAVSGIDHQTIGSDGPTKGVKAADPNEVADHATSGDPDATLKKPVSADETAPAAKRGK